jgi:tRNA(Ile)-lysidine synthase
LELQCELGRASANDSGAASGAGSEEQAREARYRFLVGTAHRLGARHLVTAHTADDQAETILHHVIRGTGIQGLSGIPRLRQVSGWLTLVRPLLDVPRSELRAYLRAIGQTFRDDPSNRDTRFTRSRIRHELLPTLRDHHNPEVTSALLRLGRLASEVQAEVDRMVTSLSDDTVTYSSPAAVSIARSALQRQSPFLRRELLKSIWQRLDWPRRSMGSAEWEALDRLLIEGTPAAVTFPGNVRARVQGEQLWLARY